MELFKSYTDNSDILEKYENTLALLNNEIEPIHVSVEKLKGLEAAFFAFINDVLSNNFNYDSNL